MVSAQFLCCEHARKENVIIEDTPMHRFKSYGKKQIAISSRVHSCVRRVFAKLFLSADVRYEVLAVKGQYYVWLSLKSNEHWSFTSSVLCSSFNSTLPSLNASAVSGMLDFVSPWLNERAGFAGLTDCAPIWGAPHRAALIPAIQARPVVTF